MKSVYVDIGNTFIKLAVKEHGIWKIAERTGHSNLEVVARRINQDYQHHGVICCSVRKDIAGKLEKSIKNLAFEQLTISQVPRGLLHYKTPDTLGMDRFLACYAAFSLAKKHVIVIDAGSACTADYMTETGIYQGGAILPGLSLTVNAFKNMLPELPLPEPVIPETWPGKTTRECIQWGMYGGFAAGIRYFVDLTLKQIRGDYQIYVCGGDAEKIAALLPDYYPVFVEPNLLFMGMELFVKTRVTDL